MMQNGSGARMRNSFCDFYGIRSGLALGVECMRDITFSTTSRMITKERTFGRCRFARYAVETTQLKRMVPVPGSQMARG